MGPIKLWNRKPEFKQSYVNFMLSCNKANSFNEIKSLFIYLKTFLLIAWKSINLLIKMGRVTAKELSLCHKLWFSHPYILSNLRYFKLWIMVDQLGIKKLEFVAKTNFLCCISCSLDNLKSWPESNFSQT